MILPTQTIVSAVGDDVQITGVNVEDMSAWTETPTVYNSAGTLLISGASVSISNTLATLTFTAGFTNSLAAGTYYILWPRTDSGQHAGLAVIRWVFEDRSKPWLTG